MPKCLNVLCVRQLEIEVTISNMTIFVKFSGFFWLFFVFLGFFMANLKYTNVKKHFPECHFFSCPRSFHIYILLLFLVSSLQQIWDESGNLVFVTQTACVFRFLFYCT